MKQQNILVLGGGVAGLSAAHELAERGFSVTVIEKNPVNIGGKASSIVIEESNMGVAGNGLPGEHGFRFFPGFYKHVTDTMSRIPFANENGGQSNCLNNLVPSTASLMAFYNREGLNNPANFPTTPGGLWNMMKSTSGTRQFLDISKTEWNFFLGQILKMLSTSASRCNDEYEKLSWWNFMEADSHSPEFRQNLVQGLTRTLVAARAEEVSVKTGGNTYLQLVIDMMKPGTKVDRVLNGPTQISWLTPWKNYLDSKNVNIIKGSEVKSLIYDGEKITGVDILDFAANTVKRYTADAYFLCVPVERAAEILKTSDKISENYPELQNIQILQDNTEWMNGIQFYLNQDVPIVHGHVLYCSSEWALTSISQVQFWNNYDLSTKFNGKVKGILSVDVSDWTHTEYKGKTAEFCDEDTVRKYVWEQLKTSLNVNGQTVLSDDMIEFVYNDRNIEWRIKQSENYNREPLLINKPDSWKLRPTSQPGPKNLYVASDYVRTFTDIATMEGANESARHAVNAFLDNIKDPAPRCKTWKLSTPVLYSPFKWLDMLIYKAGKPYSPTAMKLFIIPMLPWILGYLLFFSVKVIIYWIKNLFIKKSK